MVDRKEVQAGDDALGDDNGGQQEQQNVLDASLGGLTAEEQKQFDEMMANDSARPAEIVRDGDADDAQAAADKAAAAAAGTDGQASAAADDDGDDDGDGDADPAAATGDDDKTDPTQGGKFPQRVNYRKFKRAQERAEKAEKELAAEREKTTRIDERIKLLTEAMNQPSKQQQEQEQQQDGDEDELGPMPDPEKDIFAFATWQAKKNTQLERQLAGLTTNVVTKQADETLERTYLRDIQRFAADPEKGAPDFQNAYQHLMATRLRQLAIQMFDIDPMEEGAVINREQYDQISKLVMNEERRLVADAVKKGRSPAQVVYNMARTFGYQKAAAAAPAPGADKTNGNGQAKPANGGGQQQDGQAKPTVGAAVAAARRAAETNKTLSEGGGAPEGQLTAQQVFAMDDADFTRFMNTATPEQIRDVLGH